MARILVAEDRDDTAELMRMFLSRLGHEVEIVGDGRAAVEGHAAGDYGLVILDGAMPRADGFTAAKEIRMVDQRTPILMITAYGDTITKAHARRAGVDHVIDKPFDNDDVAEAVEYLLKNGRAR